MVGKLGVSLLVQSTVNILTELEMLLQLALFCVHGNVLVLILIITNQNLEFLSKADE